MKKFIESLRGISEPRQRVVKLIEYFEEQPPAGIAQILSSFFRDTSRLPAPLSQIHLDLVRYRFLLNTLKYEKISEVYQEALAAEFYEVQLFLRSDKSRFFDEEEKPEGLTRKIESMTLGAKKALSRKVDRQKIEPFLFDSDPLVIRELLKNPKIIEKDVLRISSRHQAPAAVLEEICKSDRWMSHYSVRKALVFNPNTPIAYTLGFVSKMHIKDVRLVIESRPRQKELCTFAKETLRRNQEKLKGSS